MRKYVNIFNKKYDIFGVHCLFKMLTKTNNIKYIRMTPKYHMHYLHCIPTKLVLYRLNKESDNFSKIVEMRITFVSSSRFMTYNLYLKQKKPMCEIKLSQILNRNPSLTNSLNRDLPHSMINRYITDEEDFFQ